MHFAFCIKLNRFAIVRNLRLLYLGLVFALSGNACQRGRKGSAFTIRQKLSFWTSNYWLFLNYALCIMHYALYYLYPNARVLKRVWKKYRANLAKKWVCAVVFCCNENLRSTYEHFINKPVLASFVCGHIMVPVRVLFYLGKGFTRVFR